MKTLIVSRTQAGAMRCIGGLVWAGERVHSARLRNARMPAGFWPTTCPFQVGDIWDLELDPYPQCEAPHTEDVVVRDGGTQLGSLRGADLEKELRRIAPTLVPQCYWEGDPSRLFLGKLKKSRPRDGKGYVDRDDVPGMSTGFWTPHDDIVLMGVESRDYHYGTMMGDRDVRCLKYIGEPEPLPAIRGGTLLRVSLARWHAVGNYPEACWLMLSGWYGDAPNGRRSPQAGADGHA